ncbi:DgyrCDS14382 [Dimorphilus gyrociliatus]|uniref:N-acetylphosphatidylethanolamine-hydrolyzing phospholipase D n=1 Tax=Dimorphilus gyrociliatus TaxID=2664684 RepID=A0A7I8WDF5_9ANNE|nr:DgyrCDS14382 [Dimorphilus gyrociliatus]
MEFPETEKQRSIFENGRFHNPWPTWKNISFLKGVSVAPKFVWNQLTSAPMVSKTELENEHPVLKPDVKILENPPTDKIQFVWIGHATFLIQMEGLNILTDPVFSHRIGPVSFIGQARYRKPAMTINELPKIDAIVISHDHYDHLDYNSVKSLNERYGNNLRWFIPLGRGKWLKDCGIEKVTELDWWEESDTSLKGVKFVCTPCQHWCKRNLTDTYKALAGSWCIIGQQQKFFFAGDTGYCASFKQIGYHYGPFTLAAIPIGAYEPRHFLQPQHVNPEEAISIYEDIKAKHFVPMHWGTFLLSFEPILEPPKRILEEVKRRNLTADYFHLPKLGQVTNVS